MDMGKDEHKNNTGKKPFAQMPKQQITTNIDVEFSEALADEDDKEAKERAEAANKRASD